MNIIYFLFIVLILSGCNFKEKHPQRYTSIPFIGKSEIQPAFKIFNMHWITEGTAHEQLNALDEFQAKVCLIPPCACGIGGYGWRGFKGRLNHLPFTGAREAGKHQERLKAIIEAPQNNIVLYQAHDPNWADDPYINPVFDTREEAEEYAKRNNMSEFEGGHSYIVREISYRYEVRQVNDAVNDLLHTCRTHNEAYEYVVEYSSAHSDLVIYDLKTGESFEETP